jgi:hypothetical protein
MGNGGEIALGPLNLKHLPITLFRAWKIVHEGAGVAEISKGIREGLLTAGTSVIGHRRFPGGASLDQITAMKKNASAMFMVVRHGMVNRYS